MIMAWCCYCALIAHFADPYATGTKPLRSAVWGNWMAGAVTTISFFALFIYPQIKWSLGGGAPVPVVLRFNSRSPLDDAAQTHFWLTDETDAGFYVFSSAGAKRAIFLPSGLSQ